MPSTAMLYHLRRVVIRRFSGWRMRRNDHSLRKAAERHVRLSRLPGQDFSDESGRLERLRFLRREHMFLDWSSWHSVVRDD